MRLCRFRNGGQVQRYLEWRLWTTMRDRSRAISQHFARTGEFGADTARQDAEVERLTGILLPRLGVPCRLKGVTA